MDQGFKCGLAECLWLRVSHELSAEPSLGVTVISRPDEGASVSKLTELIGCYLDTSVFLSIGQLTT